MYAALPVANGYFAFRIRSADLLGRLQSKTLRNQTVAQSGKLLKPVRLSWCCLTERGPLCLSGCDEQAKLIICLIICLCQESARTVIYKTCSYPLFPVQSPLYHLIVKHHHAHLPSFHVRCLRSPDLAKL
jgi:hypothetical protein